VHVQLGRDGFVDRDQESHPGEDRGLVVRHPAMKHGELQLREVNRRARQLDVELLRGYRAAEYKRLLEELNQLAERWEGLVED
jgi:hypothetical protein